MLKTRHGSTFVRTNKSKPFLPQITLQQVFDFDPARPETRTGSLFMDEVLEAMLTIVPSSEKNVAGYLDIDPHDMSGAIRILTGYDYTRLRFNLLLHRLEKIEEANKLIKKESEKLKGKALANRLGFSNRSALSKFLKSRTRIKDIEETKPYRHPKYDPTHGMWNQPRPEEN